LTDLNIKDLDMGREIIDLIINFLIYLPVGDRIRTPYADFIKVDSEFINIKVKIRTNSTVNSLEKSRIIKLV